MTNRHRRTRRALEQLFEGRPLRNAARVHEHLQTCAACQRHFNRLAALDRAARGTPDSRSEFERRYSEAVRRAPLAPSRWRRWARPGVLLVAVAALVLVSWTMFLRPTPTEPERRVKGTGAEAVFTLDVAGPTIARQDGPFRVGDRVDISVLHCNGPLTIWRRTAEGALVVHEQAPHAGMIYEARQHEVRAASMLMAYCGEPPSERVVQWCSQVPWICRLGSTRWDGVWMAVE